MTMLSLLRGGPRVLILETDYGTDVRLYLEKRLQLRSRAMEEAIGAAGGGDTLVLLRETRHGRNLGKSLPESGFFVIHEPPEELFCGLVNDRVAPLLDRAECRAGGLIVRTFGDADRIIDLIRDEFKASETPCTDVGSWLQGKGTSVFFTPLPLNAPVPPSSLHPRALLLPLRPQAAFRQLQRGIVRFVTSGLSGRSLRSIELRLYDKYGLYDLHYRRVMRVLEALELGFVVGEGWSRDFARVLLELKCYSLKMVTPLEQEAVKRVLLGLEYAADGTRILDLDLYEGKRKISWGEAAAGESRQTAGLRFREELRARLDPADREEFEALEAEILSGNW
jgi:hypothetical protein